MANTIRDDHDALPEDELNHPSLLLLPIPREKKTSVANYELDHPVPAAP